jgi:hypothetical protein
MGKLVFGRGYWSSEGEIGLRKGKLVFGRGNWSSEGENWSSEGEIALKYRKIPIHDRKISDTWYAFHGIIPSSRGFDEQKTTSKNGFQRIFPLFPDFVTWASQSV